MDQQTIQQGSQTESKASQTAANIGGFLAKHRGKLSVVAGVAIACLGMAGAKAYKDRRNNTVTTTV